MENRLPSYTVGWNANWHSHYGELWRFLTKLEIELASDPAIALMDIHMEEIRIERDTCTPKFIEALFTIARIWKQLRCP